MVDKLPPSTLREFALITCSAIEMAILELDSNKPDLCLETLTSLNSLLKELVADVARKEGEDRCAA